MSFMDLFKGLDPEEMEKKVLAALTGDLEAKMSSGFTELRTELAVAVKSQMELELAAIKTSVQDILDAHMAQVTSLVHGIVSHVEGQGDQAKVEVTATPQGTAIPGASTPAA